MSEKVEIIERLNFYIERKKGNKSALARDWGVSPPQLIQVLKGTRGLSSTMLKKALASGYNTTWLLTGQGEPFLHGNNDESLPYQSKNMSQSDELLASKDKIIELFESGKYKVLFLEWRNRRSLYRSYVLKDLRASAKQLLFDIDNYLLIID